jgi:hypothetical protein
MVHYDLAVAVAAINRNINLGGRNVSDPWYGTQVDLIARAYDREIAVVMQDVKQYALNMSADSSVDVAASS